MSERIPEYLDRPEPTRVPIEDFNFRQLKFDEAEDEAGLLQGGCLARELSNASGYNSASDVTRNNITYGEKRTFTDGRIERLIGCSSCGAMCTIVSSEREEFGPGTKEDPNIVISVAEAPQPNPWIELGNFSDCKLGKAKVPEAAEDLTKPHGLSEEERAVRKLLAGPLD